MVISEKEARFMLRMKKEPHTEVISGNGEYFEREFGNKARIEIYIPKTF